MNKEYKSRVYTEFDTIGKDNPIWRVLSWARMLKPSIPADIRDRVKWYFGMEVNHNG